MSVSPTIARSRAQVWLDGLGDWSWPGARPLAELAPPPWVPALPPRLALAVPAGSAGHPSSSARERSRLALFAAMLALLALTCAGAAALAGPAALERLAGIRAATSVRPVARVARASAPLPSPRFIDVAASGSTIHAVRYDSAALHGHGFFLVYMPPRFSLAGQRYPVLYLLHGNGQRATAFLQMGVRATLDRLIARHAIAPLVAVMVQGGPGANNWRDQGKRRYESYVLEVQQLVDRMYPTIASRRARAIAGESMGGYGAMNLALGHPDRFGTVESWLGFFNGLTPELRAARALIKRAGLHAFLYGASADTIADPAENAPFAAALRAAGADATGAVYAGEHDVETLEAHLAHMLVFAARSIAPAAARWPASQ